MDFFFGAAARAFDFLRLTDSNFFFFFFLTRPLEGDGGAVFAAIFLILRIADGRVSLDG